MSSGKNLRMLHAQADQIVYIEETPIVDFLAGNTPVREAIDL